MDAQPPGSRPEPGAGATRLGDPVAPAGHGDVLAPLVPTGPPIRPARRSRWRVVFAVVLAAIPLLCVGVIPLAFHSYDTATRPDRSAPDVVVQGYLQAFLGRPPDDAGVRQYVCSDPAALAAFRAFRADLQSREKRFNVTFTERWGLRDVVPEGNNAASVTTDISIEQASGPNSVTSQGEQKETWSFRVVRSPDWRVCGATRVG